MSSGALTIVCIDDDRSSSLLVERALAAPSVRVLTASSAATGLALACAERPELVLLDLNLPDAPGTDVLRQLRGDARTAATRVVIVSADATRERHAELRAAGASGLLIKPYDLARLRAITGLGHTRVAAAPRDRPRPAVLDPARIAELRALDDDGAALRELLGLALAEAAELVAALGPDAGARMPDRCAPVAHGIRTAAAVLGARELGAAAAAIEHCAQREITPGRTQIGTLRRAYRDAEQGVASVLSELDAEGTGR